MVKNWPAKAGDAEDVGSIPESGGFPGEENGNLFMDRGVWWATVQGVTKSWM